MTLCIKYVVWTQTENASSSNTNVFRKVRIWEFSTFFRLNNRWYPFRSEPENNLGTNTNPFKMRTNLTPDMIAEMNATKIRIHVLIRIGS